MTNDQNDLRAELAQRITERNQAAEAFATASRNASKAAALLTEAETELEKYADTDVKVTKLRGEQLASVIKRSDAPVVNGAADWLPDALKAELRERDHAAAAEQTTRSALIDLNIEKAQAQQIYEHAQQRVVNSAAAVLAAEAQEIAAEYAVAQRLAWVLRDRLVGFTRTWLPAIGEAPPIPIALPPSVRGALDLEREMLAGNQPHPQEWQARLFGDYLQRLLQDADAEFVERDPEPIDRALQPAGTVLFVPQDRSEAERIADCKRQEAETHKPAKVPSHIRSLIDLAVAHGTMRPFEP